MKPAPASFQRMKIPGWNADTLFLILVLLQTSVFWLFPMIPTSDGPVHLYNALILKNYFLPESAPLREFFVLNLLPNPNWLIQPILSLLLFVFSPNTAEKILATGYLIGFPYAFRFALRQMRPSSEFLAFLALPLTTQWLFFLGLYNFFYGTLLYLMILGYSEKYCRSPARHHTFILSCLMALLSLTHLVPCILSAVTLIVLEVWRFLAARIPAASGGSTRQEPPPPQTGRILTSLVIPALVIGFFLIRKGTGEVFGFPDYPEMMKRLQIILSPKWLSAFTQSEFVPYGILLTAFLSLFFYVFLQRRFHSSVRLWGGFFLVFFLLLALTLAVPSAASGGTVIYPRTALYMLYMVLFMASFAAYSQEGRNFIVLLSAFLVLILAGLHIHSFRSLNQLLKNYHSCDASISPGSLLVQVNFPSDTRSAKKRAWAERLDPFYHQVMASAHKSAAIPLTHFTAHWDHHTVSYRKQWDLYSIVGKSLDEMELKPLEADLSLFELKTGRAIDNILVWDIAPENLRSVENTSLFQWIGNNYTAVCSSDTPGALRLYQRKSEKTA